MNRGLGAGLVLSVLVHGGAVAAIAVLGATWLMAPLPVSSPPALYVDLVYPVIATSDREESADGRASSRPTDRSRGAGMTGSRSRAPVGAARSTEAPTGVPAPATRGAAPAADGAGPAAVAALEAVPPPAAPVAPRASDAPPESKLAPAPSPAPASDRPTSSPPATTVASSPPAPPLAPDFQPREATVDPAPTPSRGVASTTVTAAAPSSDAAPVHQSSGASTASGGTRDASGPTGGVSGDPGMRGAPGGSGVDASGRGGQTSTTGDGDATARLSPGAGGGPAGRGSNGAIPPEYESYVRALRQRIQDRLVYPWTAVRRGQEGVVELEVRLGADGRLVGVEVVAGVSADALRGAAVSAVRDSAPFPFPPGLPARPLVVRLPVEFRLR